MPINNRGFTLLELVIIIVVFGILSVSVSTRFFSSSDVASGTTVDQIIADIQYTQVLAMGKRQQWSIQFGQEAEQGGGCSQSGGGGGGSGGGCSFPGLGGDGSIFYYQVDGETKKYLPSGVTVSNATLTFDSLGELTGGTDKTVSVGGTTITVYRTTGKVANW